MLRERYDTNTANGWANGEHTADRTIWTIWASYLATSFDHTVPSSVVCSICRTQYTFKEEFEPMVEFNDTNEAISWRPEEIDNGLRYV